MDQASIQCLDTSVGCPVTTQTGMSKHEKITRSLFSSVWMSRWDTSSSCSYGFSNESRRNRMFWFADLNRISNQAYRNYGIRFVVDDLILHA